jgi:hypothetical protein
MQRSHRVLLARLVVALGLVVLSAPASPRKPKPEPCPTGRYLVSGERLITDRLSTDLQALDIDVARRVVTIPGCGERHAVVTAKARVTTVTAKWASCGELRKVALRVRIPAPGCTGLQGHLKARKAPAQTFAGVLSTCGDGVVDPVREECDGSTCADGRDCKDDCTCPAPVIVNSTTTTSSVTTTSVGSTSTTSTSTTLPGTSTSSSTSTTIATTTSSSTSTSTSSTTTTVAPTCGNSILEAGEDCDPPGMLTCPAASPGGAFVACSQACTCPQPTTSTSVTTSTLAPFCGNFVVESGEACDPPLSACTPAGGGDGICTYGCTCAPVGCGNGVLEPGETCDPPGAPGQCKPTAPGGGFVACQPGCTCPPQEQFCGNFTVDPGESCDPPFSGCLVNGVLGFCSAGCACTPPQGTCGNFTLDAGEACDPPGIPFGCPPSSPGGAFTACRSDCTCPPHEPFCGDYHVDAGEDCDPPFTGCTPAEGGASICSPTCTCSPPMCGNGVTEPGETCDPPGAPFRCPPTTPGGGFVPCAADCTCPPQEQFCGNFTVDPGESCDPPFSPCFQNGAYGYCSPDCACTPPQGTCGDFQIEAGEACDPPGAPSRCPAASPFGPLLACNADCTCPPHEPYCGDGTVDPGEDCEPPFSPCTPEGGGQGLCSSTCTCAPPVCGNGITEPGEACDPPGAPFRCKPTTPDSGFVPCGDGCTCPVQEQFCGNYTLDPGEACDPPFSPCLSGFVQGFCSPTCECTPPVGTCGNFFIEAGEDCDPPGAPNRCRPTSPGGAFLDCNADCTCPPRIPSCGDGFLDPGEECDPPGSGQCDGESPASCSAKCTCQPVACADPSRTIFAGGPGSSACQQFEDDVDSCEHAWHVSGNGKAASCFVDAICSGCGPNNESDGSCTNTCGAGAPKDTCDDPSRTIFAGGPGSSACHQFDGDPNSCEHAWHATSNHGAASCFIVNACQGCGPNNEDGGRCTNTCVAQ